MRRIQDDDEDVDEGKRNAASIDQGDDSPSEQPNKKARFENDTNDHDVDDSKQGGDGPSDQGDQDDTSKISADPGVAPSTSDPSQNPATISNEGQATQETADNASKANGGDSSQSKKNPYDMLRWTIVKNDGRPESLIKLVALKSLFAKQLPKMPKAYIARLVFERRHVSLVILNDDPKVKDTDKEVIGAICYRPFPEMRFAEIAFCAVNSDHQVKVRSKMRCWILLFCHVTPATTHIICNKLTPSHHQGYGTKLMNLVKKEGARTGIEYFITYADNYAIGYFKKQGFSKTVSMPKGRYHGLIKDYDGGTMMECYVHPSIDFTRIPEMLAAQRKFILSRIRLKANSTRVYDPLPKGFSPNLEGVSRANETAARAMAIPGMMEAGWTMADLIAATGQGKDADRAKNALKSEMLNIVRKVEEQQFAWPFREPVDINEVKVSRSIMA